MCLIIKETQEVLFSLLLSKDQHVVFRFKGPTVSDKKRSSLYLFHMDFTRMFVMGIPSTDDKKIN